MWKNLFCFQNGVIICQPAVRSTSFFVKLLLAWLRLPLITSEATENPRLKPFTFYGFNRKDVLTKLENTGRTRGLGERYDSLQFHLHWGNGTRVPGSEHTLNGKQFPMELHIVNIKSSLNGDTDAAVRDPAGLAALGFFIEVRKSSELVYLSSGQSVDIKQPISLNSLLGGVSLTDYFRYNGSLTTPDCNEAVVWTVFKDPIKISADLVRICINTSMFSPTSSCKYPANRSSRLTSSAQRCIVLHSLFGGGSLQFKLSSSTM
uniref:Carbonic anhydrase n=1 Tax=Salarias fasciatus TaxID=181472 RepID=A0A672JTG5_SALFA